MVNMQAKAIQQQANPVDHHLDRIASVFNAARG